MSTPVRIQLRRTRGWRMPENTVKVTRPGPWGNPFIVNPGVRPGSGGHFYINVPTVEDAVACYEEMLRHLLVDVPGLRARMDAELRGKNLACWCKAGPCHADVLLRIANEEPSA